MLDLESLGFRGGGLLRFVIVVRFLNRGVLFVAFRLLYLELAYYSMVLWFLFVS